MMSNYLHDKSVAPSSLESLPFNEWCIYTNDYMDELKIRKENMDEHNAEMERIKSQQ
jgi:hypothetical protein